MPSVSIRPTQLRLPLVLALLLTALRASASTSEGNPSEKAATRDAEIHFADRTWALEGVIGLGTLVGEAGVVLTATPLERLSVVTGIGVTPWGPHFGVGLRLRPWVVSRTSRLRLRQNTVHAFTLAPGLSMGDWEDSTRVLNYDTDTAPVAGATVRPAMWLQLDVGYEWRRRSGFSFFVGPGLNVLLNGNQCVDYWSGDVCTERQRSTVPKALLAVSFFMGHAF